MQNDLAYYVSGPNFAGSLTLVRQGEGWNIECHAQLKAIIGDLPAKEFKSRLVEKGFRTWDLNKLPEDL